MKRAFSDSTFPQFCAYILCMTDGSPDDKAPRLMELFFALEGAGKKYRKGHEMEVPAALSLTNLSTGELMDTVIEIEAILSKQKDYGVLSGFDEKRRLMNAAMLATAAYGNSRNGMTMDLVPVFIFCCFDSSPVDRENIIMYHQPKAAI